MTTKEAKFRLSELCAPLDFTIGHAHDSDYSEKGPQRFTFNLAKGFSWTASCNGSSGKKDGEGMGDEPTIHCP